MLSLEVLDGLPILVADTWTEGALDGVSSCGTLSKDLSGEGDARR